MVMSPWPHFFLAHPVCDSCSALNELGRHYKIKIVCLFVRRAIPAGEVFPATLRILTTGE